MEKRCKAIVLIFTVACLGLSLPSCYMRQAGTGYGEANTRGADYGQGQGTVGGLGYGDGRLGERRYGKQKYSKVDADTTAVERTENSREPIRHKYRRVDADALAVERTESLMQPLWSVAGVLEHVQTWKYEPRQVVNVMLEKYGVPEEVTDHRLVWRNKGDFVEIILTNEEIAHDFPMPHRDFLKHTVRYDVPVEKYSDISRYDGSIILDRTKGTMSARCDNEAMNLLALNLAYEIAQGRRTVDEARNFYAQTAVATLRGQASEYTQGLIFMPKQSSGNEDNVIIDRAILEELKKRNEY